MNKANEGDAVKEVNDEKKLSRHERQSASAVDLSKQAGIIDQIAIRAMPAGCFELFRVMSPLLEVTESVAYYRKATMVLV